MALRERIPLGVLTADQSVKQRGVMMTLSRRALAVTFRLLIPDLYLSASQTEPPPARTGPPEITMSLAEAVRMGLENNLDVRVASKTPLIREQDTLIQNAAFDPNLRFFGEKQDN